MGNTWTVKSWVQTEGPNIDYKWREDYAGEAPAEAIAAFLRAKSEGIGCVVLEWR